MPDIQRIGFIGLGIMGRPMARNLIRAGYQLIVWNRSRPGIEALIAGGATTADSAREVAQQSDAVITVVGYTEDVEQVTLGPSGIIEGAHPGLVHIDMSTIAPDVTRRIAARLAQAGIEMLDAPVSGGEAALFGRVELSKYYEHVERDYLAALEHVQAALHVVELYDSSWPDANERDLNHRLSRLLARSMKRGEWSGARR
jgi:hypothetical protein